VVVDAAAALMMDPGAMLKRDTNLSNLSYITPEDAKLGRLRLEFPTASVARFKLGVGVTKISRTPQLIIRPFYRLSQFFLKHSVLFSAPRILLAFSS